MSNLSPTSNYPSPRNVIDLAGHFGFWDRNTTRLDSYPNGLIDVLWQIGMCAGWNPQYVINACDDATPLVGAWTESDSGTFDVSSAAVDNRVATNVLLLTATAACDNTQYAELRYINGGSLPATNPDTGIAGMDWRDTDYVGFWMSALAAGGFGTAGEMTFALVNTDGTGTETVSSKINLPIAVNAVHQRVELNISALTRDNVVAMRFYCNNLNAAEGIEVDSMIRYKFGNGKGPANGQIVMIPIASAQTLVRGQICQVNSAQVAGITVQPEAASAIDTQGVCVIGGTGTASGSVKAAVQIAGFAYLRMNAATVAGENIIWQSADATYGHLCEGGATGEDEIGFAKCFEAAGAQYDDIACIIGHAQTFIS